MSLWIFKKDKSGKEKVYSTDLLGSFLLLIIILGILATAVLTRISDRAEKVFLAKVIGTSFLSKTASEIRWVRCSSSEYDDFWIKAGMEDSDFSELVFGLQLTEEPNLSAFSPTLLAGPPCDEKFEWEDLSKPGKGLFINPSSETSRTIADYKNGWCYLRRRMVRTTHSSSLPLPEML